MVGGEKGEEVVDWLGGHLSGRSGFEGVRDVLSARTGEKMLLYSGSLAVACRFGVYQSPRFVDWIS